MRSVTIGDMWRQKDLIGAPTTGPEPIWYRTEPKKVWIYNGVDWAQRGTQVRRMEHDSGHIIKLQGKIYDNLTSPEDTEPIPESLDLQFGLNPIATVDTFIGWFKTRYGDLFQVTSEWHKRVFVGVVPTWTVEYYDDCQKQFGFQMLVRNSYRHE